MVKQTIMTTQQKLLAALTARAAGKPKVKAKIKKIKQRENWYNFLAR